MLALGYTFSPNVGRQQSHASPAAGATALDVYMCGRGADLVQCAVQYETQIDAIVEQAQQVGAPDEGLWCCTI